MTITFTELRAAEISVKKSLTGSSRATHYRHVNPKGPMHGPWSLRAPPSQPSTTPNEPWCSSC